MGIAVQIVLENNDIKEVIAEDFVVTVVENNDSGVVKVFRGPELEIEQE